jgi:4-amino-4-deoxy-L-arabinose transferase-like glycosyltransferase
MIRKYIPDYLVVIALVLAAYLWSMPRTVVFEDDGLFILAAYFNGISHPPGYPVYTLLGHLATWLPLGSVAARVHALSALFGALSCLCLWWLVHTWLRDRVYAMLAALVCGFSATFWSQAIIAEVYTLNAFLFFLICILVVRWQERAGQPGSERLLCWAGFVYGIGLSNHWPLLVLSSPMLLALAWPQWRRLFRNFHKPLFFCVIGLLPYLWMVIRSRMNPEISFLGPIDSLSEFWYCVSRQIYSEVDHNIDAGFVDKLWFCLFSLQETARQFGYGFSVLIVAGFLAQWKYLDKRTGIALVAGYLGSTLVLALLLGFEYDLEHKNLFKVYPLIAFSIAAIWFVIGLKWLLETVIARYLTVTGTPVIKSLIVMMVVISVAIINLPGNYRAEDTLAYYYARILLQSLDRDAVFFTFVDSDVAPVAYLNKIEKLRSDVTLMNVNGFVFSNRLFKPSAAQAHKHEQLSQFLKNENRPVYYIRGIPALYGRNDFGLYYQVNKELDESRVKPAGRKSILDFFENVLNTDRLYDPWEVMMLESLSIDYCRLATYFYLNGIERYGQESLRRICRGYKAGILMVEILIEHGYTGVEMMENVLASLQESDRYDRSRMLRADVEYLRGRLKLLKNENVRALEHFNRSITIWPNEANKAYAYAREIRVPDMPAP